MILDEFSVRIRLRDIDHRIALFDDAVITDFRRAGEIFVVYKLFVITGEIQFDVVARTVGLSPDISGKRVNFHHVLSPKRQILLRVNVPVWRKPHALRRMNVSRQRLGVFIFERAKLVWILPKPALFQFARAPKKLKIKM